MKLRFTSVFLAAVAAGMLVAGGASAAMVGIYRNTMTSTAQRSQLLKLSGQSCSRGGFNETMRIVVGKRTGACSYRTPVVGRDLEIAAVERLLSGTDPALQHQAYLGLQLRAGGGAKYELRVFPLQQKAQLLKVLAGGETQYLAIDKEEAAVKGVNMANALRLRATNATSGPEKGQARLFAYIGSALVAEATDEAAGELAGRASAVTVGATKSANGLIASVDDVVVRVPSPF